MLAREQMSQHPAVIAADDNITQAAEMMSSRGVGMLPVVEDYDTRRLVGVITDRDIVTRYLAKGRGPFALVREFMSHDPLVSVRPDTPLEAVADTMSRHHVRRVPVATVDGVLKGVITHHDLTPATAPKNASLVERVVEQLARPAGASR